MKTLSFKDLQATEAKTDFIVEPLIACGSLGCIAAAPKSNKSLTMIALAHDLACGLPAFGQFKSKPVSVLIVETEDPQTLVLERCRMLQKGKGYSPLALEKNLHFLFPENLKLDEGSTGADEIIKAAEETKAEIIFLDVLSRLMTGSDTSEVEAKLVIAAMNYIRKKTQAAVIFLHHQSRAAYGKNYANPNVSLRGSSVFSGALENSLYLTKHLDGEIVTVKYETKYAQSGEFALTFLNKDGALKISTQIPGNEVMVDTKTPVIIEFPPEPEEQRIRNRNKLYGVRDYSLLKGLLAAGAFVLFIGILLAYISGG